MSLIRLNPLINTTDLGWLRLSQDDLAQMVRIVETLEDVEVVIKSGTYQLTDVRTDLPKLGKRVSDFTIRAVRSEGAARTTPVVSVELTSNRSKIIAEDPDLHALGLVETLRRLSGECSRMPMWLVPFFRSDGRTNLRRGFTPLLGGATCVAFLIGTFTLFDGTSHLLAKVVALLIVLAMAALLASIGVGIVRARAVIYTAPGAETPTFWEQYRADIGIHIVVGAVFFALGLLVGHL